MNNPYAGLINLMRDHGSAYNPPSIKIGIIVSDKPLKIQVGDIQIDKDNIFIADFLIEGYKRKFSLSVTDTKGDTSSVVVGDHGSHKHDISNISIAEGELTFKETLKKGDFVACLATEDGQNYIVLCKVLRP